MTTNYEARPEARPFAGVGRLIEECLGKLYHFERNGSARASLGMAAAFAQLDREAVEECRAAAEALPEQPLLPSEETPEALRARFAEAKLNYEQARSLFMSVNINPHPDKKWVRKVLRRAVKAWHEYEEAYTMLFYLGDGSVDANLRP